MRIAVIVTSIAAVTGCDVSDSASRPGGPPSSQSAMVQRPKPDLTKLDLKSLMKSLGWADDYRVTPYLSAAVQLQAMGKTKAIAELQRRVNEKVDDIPVQLLCRMLFTKKPGGEFPQPYIGELRHIGWTAEGDWPLSPLAMVDGIPFCIVDSYCVLGQGPDSWCYLDACMQKCEWSQTKFRVADADTLERALRKLLASKKWKRPLSDGERKFLESQIE